MDLNVSIPKIRPCPFCGGRELITYSNAGEWFVYCPACKSIGPHGDVDTALKEFPDEAVASVAAKILAIEMWNDCPRKYLTVDDLNDEELYELKQNHYIKEHPDNDLEGVNKNIASNILRSKFYVCPLCGNIIRTVGDAVISCCGIILPPLEAEETDNEHNITIEIVEDEHFITINHNMTKEHYISFIAHITYDRVQFVKFYPEGNAETRLNLRGGGWLYFHCNKHGLMKTKI